jgi:NAD(P)-dependent dehydrogenase (short-subunit alcohol dehydrogenase family)
MGTMRPDFTGDVVFVTGASGGMGRAISVAFAQAGAQLVMADIDEAGGAETERLAREAGTGNAVFVRTDVSNAEQVAAAVHTAVDRFGRLDCAVNAAAIETETAALHECDDDNFDRMQAINVRGLFLSMKHELAAILANDPRDGSRGAIVNIASTNSFRPQHDQPAYTASKHAVLGLTRSAAYDYAPHGVRVNAICPGTIDTPMLRKAMERRGRDPQDVIGRLSLIGRFGRPDEIAAAALWLCSDASSFTIGHALAVDAGYLAR